jgi:hypothetical protein
VSERRRDLQAEFAVARDAMALAIAHREQDWVAFRTILDGYPGEYEKCRLMVDGFVFVVQALVMFSLEEEAEGEVTDADMIQAMRELIREAFSPPPDHTGP